MNGLRNNTFTEKIPENKNAHKTVSISEKILDFNEQQKGKGLKILTPKQMLSPLSPTNFQIYKKWQFLVFQKVWDIGVTKSIKLKKFFVRFLFYGYWKFLMSQR